MDRISPAARSRNMSHIRSKDTLPELIVRRYLHAAGLRYRLHAPKLPGKPDLVFSQRRICLFVHGCFWHGHDCVRGARAPKINADYWRAKIARNRARDETTLAAYAAMGWRTLVVYECELKDRAALNARLGRALSVPAPSRVKPLELLNGASVGIDKANRRS